MTDPFIVAAGPAPARNAENRWRQVALLSASSALGDDGRAATGLAAALLALDHPAAAAQALSRADAADPWARWWGVLAAGQAAGASGLRAALDSARAVPAAGPDAREVARRLEDLDAELAALDGGPADAARFAVLGHRARPERRMLIGGRSSAAFLVDPGWDALRVVRLAPSEGPSAGNRAHMTLEEIIGAVRRGEAGPGWHVPGDEPPSLDPQAMLGALREDPSARDRRLVRLAQEVAEERERLVEERAALAEERAILAARRAAAAARGRRPRRPRRRAGIPAEAAELLGVAAGARLRGGARLPRPGHPVPPRPRRRPAPRRSAARPRASPWRSTPARDLLLGRAPRRRAQRASG